MSNGNQPLILMVDDKSNDLNVLGSILYEQGYKIAPVKSGNEVFEFVSKKSPDLILLDILMPEIDGYEVCRKLQEKPETKGIPIIFISALNDIIDKVKGFELGGVDYITKPFNKHEVLSRINTHLTISNQKKELKELNRTKDKFFSIIAHDLRNPLGAFQTATGVLMTSFAELNDDEKLELITMMNKSASNLYSLLENLLYWSKSQRDLVKVFHELIDLNSLVNDNFSLIKINAQKKDIELVSKVPDEFTFYSDLNMVNTVLRNLISNAIKFTDEAGKVEVSARLKSNNYEICVSDTGIGIEGDIIEKLFRIDLHLTTKGTSKEEGTGLGLILCKEFIEKMGGKIWIESQPGVGSKFFLTIPNKE